MRITVTTEDTAEAGALCKQQTPLQRCFTSFQGRQGVSQTEVLYLPKHHVSSWSRELNELMHAEGSAWGHLRNIHPTLAWAAAPLSGDSCFSFTSDSL